MQVSLLLQGIAIGVLCGLSSAAGIIVGNSLGADENDKAYSQVIEFVKLTVGAGLAIGMVIKK